MGQTSSITMPSMVVIVGHVSAVDEKVWFFVFFYWQAYAGIIFTQWSKNWFLPRDAMHKRGICRHAVSVCLSVCLSRSWVSPKWIKLSSNFFHHVAA